MNVKKNKKYQTTHQAIMSVLMGKLKEKSIKQVSVTEICRSVQINRSTFYEHFLDVYDVLEQIADKVSSEVLKNTPKTKPTKADFIYLLQHIQSNKEFYTLFFHQNLPLNVYEKFFLNKRPPFPPHTPLNVRGTQNDIQLEYHETFFKAGLDAILKKWLERNCTESPEEIYELIYNEYSS